MFDDLITRIAHANEPMATEAFGGSVDEAQRIDESGVTYTHLVSLDGTQVPMTPQTQEFYRAANGATHVVFGERWVSVTEMADPMGDAFSKLEAFDPVSEMAAAKDSFLRALEDEIYAYQEISGRDATGEIPPDAALVLFGYNLIELGSRPTYLYFEAGRDEAEVWSSSVEWTTVYTDLLTYLAQYDA